MPPKGWSRPPIEGYRPAMTEEPHTHDQDAEPPTPTGEEPDTEQLEPGSEPASHPDPDPAPSTDGNTEEEA